MKHIYILLLGWCLAGVAHAHSTLSGHIMHAETNHPVPGAVVQIQPGYQYATTDENGNFTLRGLAGGRYVLKTSMLGFVAKQIAVDLVDNESRRLEIALTEKNMSVEEVVITPTSELGSKTVSGIDIKNRPVNSTQDLLRLVPGLFIAQHAGGGKAEQIFLRGFDCDHGTDVAVSVDGIPVNMVSHAHGQGYADLHFVIPEMVNNLSFSKGPYDAKTGDLNTAGAVRFQTKNQLTKSFVKLEGGRYGYMRGVGAFNLLGNGDTINQKQNAYVATEYLNSDGFFDHSQNFKRINVLAKYNLALDDRTHLSLSASHFTSGWDASGQVPDRAVADGTISRFGSIDPTEGGNTSRQNLNVVLSKSLPYGAVIRNQVFFSHYQFSLFSNFTFFANDSVNGDQIHQFENRNMYGYNGTYSQGYQLGNVNMTSLVGLSLRDDDIGSTGLDHTRRRQFVSTERLGSIAQTNAAIYTEQVAQISSRLTANVGLRLDAFRFRYNSALIDTPGNVVKKTILSPKLNIYYNLTPKTQVYVSAGSGFHSNDARAVTAKPNGNTLPRATGVDFGVNIKPTKRLFVNAAFWVLDLESEFVYAGDNSVIEPSGYSRRTGVDVSVRYQLTDFLFADLDVNATKPRFTSGPETERYVPLAPRITSIGGLTLQLKKGLSGSLRYRYLGRRPAIEDNSITAAGYVLADAVVTYATGPYIFNLSGENLLNVKWKEAQFATESRLPGEKANVNEIHFTPGTPLFVKAGATIQF